MIGIFAASKFQIPTTQMLFDGDSMTALNSGMTSAQTWPNKLKVMIDALTWFDFYNSGVGGHTIDQMMANVATEIDAKFSGTYVRHVAFLWGGINSLYQNADNTGDSRPEEVFVKWSNYLSARKTAGFSTVGFTITATQNPLYPSLHAEIERGRLIFNDFVRNSAGVADVIIDLDADARIGGYNAVLDSTYFQTDKIHMNDVGRQVVADLVKANLWKIPITDVGGGYVNPVSQDVTDYFFYDDNETALISYNPSPFTIVSVGGAVGGSWRYKNSVGAKYTVTLSTCTRIKLRFFKSSVMGQMDIYLDGVFIETINGYHPTLLNSEINWDSGDLTPATRVLEVRKSTADSTTNVGIDAIYWKSAIIQNNDSGWSNTGTWNDGITSTTFYRNAGSGSVCSSVGGTKTRDLPVGTSRVKLFSPKFSGGGTIKMQVIRLSDSAVVYDANFSQAGTSTIAGGADRATPQLDSGVLPVVPYKVVLTCVTASCSFDAIEYEL